jgi:hypothetical protein
MTRSDDGKPTGFQQTYIAAAVEHRWRVFTKAFL